MPAFSLTSQNGIPYGSAELVGKVYVANFIFTTCPSVCPLLTRAMEGLQLRFSQHKLPIELLSLSVEPDVDTPKKLIDYAQSRNLKLSNWNFLTGDKNTVFKLLEEGFKVGAVGRTSSESSQDSAYDIAHSGKFVLVDKTELCAVIIATTKRSR